MTAKVFRIIVGTAIAAAMPRAALACPVCFGQSDSPLAIAMNWGILAMLGVTAAVLIAFASFFLHLVRQARLVEEAHSLGPGDSAHSGGAL